MNIAAINTCTSLYVDYILISLGKIPTCEAAELDGRLVFNFLRNCQTVFKGGFSILYSHQPCRRVLAAPHPCQDLVFLILAIPICA